MEGCPLLIAHGLITLYNYDVSEFSKADPTESADQLPARLIGETVYVLFVSAPRVVAEGLRVRLDEAKIPVFLETPFTQFGMGDFYMGTYTGDVTLWVPHSLYNDAEMILERDQQGETL